MKRKSWTLFLSALLWIYAGSAVSSELLAGAGRVDITPKKGTPLAGYQARWSKPSLGVHDPIYARALVLESGGRRAAIVSTDLLIITLDFRQEVLDRIQDLNLDWVDLSATHTHSGPGAYHPAWIAEFAVLGHYDPSVREELVAGIARAVREAAGKLQPARFAATVTQAPGFARNRRHPGGPVDPSFFVAEFMGTEGRPIAFLVNYAAHPTVLPQSNFEFSGDYAGRLEADLEAAAPGSVALFLAGPLGDQAPCFESGDEDFATVDKIGDGLARIAENALAALQPTAEVKMTLYHETMPVPKGRVKPSCFFGLGWLMPRVGRDLVRTRTELLGMGLNDALLLFSPAEMAVEVGKAIKDEHPGRPVMLAVHSNDLLGYVLTAEDYRTGGYESCMNFYGSGFAADLEKGFADLVPGQ